MRRATPESAAAVRRETRNHSKGAWLSAPRWRPTRTQVGIFLAAAGRDGEVTEELYEK